MNIIIFVLKHQGVIRLVLNFIIMYIMHKILPKQFILLRENLKRTLNVTIVE